MVSVFGGLMVVAAGVIYWGMDPWGWAWPIGALTGMALHLGWHVVDGADGDLARMTGRASPIGEIVDGLCDYASHVVVYFLLAAVLQRSIGGFAWPIMVAAGVSHVVQSNHVEVERRFYLAWIYGVPWLHHTKTKANGLTGMMLVFRPIVALYMRLAAGLTPRAGRIDAAVTAAAFDAEKLARIRAIIGEERRPLLPLLKIMGPNPRAIVLGLGMLAGSPFWFFAYQALVLNALMALSLVLHDRAAQRIGARLGQAGLMEALV
jgi:phosphatidylglycerophosphate synthase